MFVKITQCSIPRAWYAEMVGKVVEVEPDIYDSKGYVSGIYYIAVRNETSLRANKYLIEAKDCEIIQEEKDEGIQVDTMEEI